jgi:hypothetical protein
MEIKGLDNYNHFEVWVGGGKMLDVYDKDNPIRWGTIGLLTLGTKAAFD